jgi:hypothetical protein
VSLHWEFGPFGWASNMVPSCLILIQIYSSRLSFHCAPRPWLKVNGHFGVDTGQTIERKRRDRANSLNRGILLKPEIPRSNGAALSWEIESLVIYLGIAQFRQTNPSWSIYVLALKLLLFLKLNFLM